MLKKSLYAFILLFCTNVLLSVFASCECKDKHDYCVHISGTTLKAIDNSGRVATDVQNGKVIAKALILEMTINIESLICKRPGKFTGFFTAYAFTRQPCDTYSRLDSIVSYDLYSDNDFDSEHPAGSSLLHLFNHEGMDNLNYYYSGEDKVARFYSKAAVSDSGTHVLTFRLVDHQGDTILASTPPLKLLK